MICIMFPNQEGAGGTGASHINSLLTLTVGKAKKRAKSEGQKARGNQT